MSPELEKFLATEDLDALLRAQDKLSVLDKQDNATIRTLLQQWDRPQAIANLLFHPMLIPQDIRLPSLLRGLAEQQVDYYVLAAVVGLQSIKPDEITEEERRRISRELLTLIRERMDVVAARASVSVAGFSTEEDAPQMFALLEHSNKTVRHNILVWLIRTFENRGLEPFIAVAQASELPEEARRSAIEKFSNFLFKLQNPHDSQKPWTHPIFPLYSYIPNLRDVARG